MWRLTMYTNIPSCAFYVLLFHVHDIQNIFSINFFTFTTYVSLKAKCQKDIFCLFVRHCDNVRFIKTCTCLFCTSTMMTRWFVLIISSPFEIKGEVIVQNSIVTIIIVTYVSSGKLMCISHPSLSISFKIFDCIGQLWEMRGQFFFIVLDTLALKVCTQLNLETYFGVNQINPNLPNTTTYKIKVERYQLSYENYASRLKTFFKDLWNFFCNRKLFTSC